MTCTHPILYRRDLHGDQAMWLCSRCGQFLHDATTRADPFLMLLELEAERDAALKSLEAITEQIAAVRAERDALRAALASISESLRKAGATLPAPEPVGTIEGAMNGGLCIALCVVEEAMRRVDAAMKEPPA